MSQQIGDSVCEPQQHLPQSSENNTVMASILAFKALAKCFLLPTLTGNTQGKECPNQLVARQSHHSDCLKP
jgi:hypothetical protein